MFSIDRTRLRRLAFLYLRIAHQSDDYLSDSELESITQKLATRSRLDDRSKVQQIVMEALDEYLESVDVSADMAAAAGMLSKQLTEDEKRETLEDLHEIAEADGVLLKHEKEMLRSLAQSWGVRLSAEDAESAASAWGVLHDLAYIYLVLAHSTDFDLSDTEMQVMLNKLREWQPQVSVGDVKRVLSNALRAYSDGDDTERLETAIQSVRRALPREQRMAALNDLVKIANADGVFLDDEEDLINHLLTEWEVDPYANYGPHGSKDG